MARTASQIARSNVSRSKVHERRVAKLLSEWTGKPFRRRRVTGRDDATRMVELTADVIALEGDFKCSIEAKCGRGFSLDALLGSPHTAKFTEWWHQTCYDATIASNDLGRRIYPLLFFKPIPAQDWIAISAHLFGAHPDALTQRVASILPPAGPWFAHLFYDHYRNLGPVAGNVSHTKNKRIVKLELDPVVLCRWHDFANAIDPTSAYVNAKIP